MSRRTLPRHHALALILLTFVAIARGGYWAVTFEVWSPVDEAQHFGYVESLATGDGIPTVGRDRLSDDVMEIAKASPTYFGRSRPFEGDGSDDRWGAAVEQYEGIHGPTYYALMVPAYWTGRPIHPLAALYAVRFATVLLTAAAVPLAWALARRLLPDRPLAWLLGPGLLVAVNGFMATGATATNDALVITGSVVALLLAARAATTERWLPAALAGGATGAVVVGKSTALGLIPLIGLMVLIQAGNGAATAQRWRSRLLTTGAGAAVVILPWLAWNLATYGSISAAEAAEAITGALQSPIEPGLDAVRRHWMGARLGFWESGLLTGEASHRRLWDLITVAVGSVGLVAAARRWRREELVSVGALGAAFPLAFLTMVALFFVVLGSSGLMLGRYVYVALVPLLLGLGAAVLAIAGRRWAPPLLLAIASVGLWSEIDLTDRYLTTTYERGVIDPALAPVVDQSWNDGPVRADAVVVESSCPAEVVEIGFERPPDLLEVMAADGAVRGRQVASVHTGFTTYELERPAPGPLRIPVPATSGVWVSATEREPEARLDGASQDPLVRVWCRVGAERAAEVRFDRTYDLHHPALSREVLRAWPRAWFGAAVALTLLAAGLAVRRRPTAPT